MSRKKKIGIILILLGLFIPCILYPFATPTMTALVNQSIFAEKGVFVNIRLSELEIVLKEGTVDEDAIDKTASTYTILSKLKYKGRITIPYKDVLAFGIVLVFTGAGIIALSNNKG